MADEKNQNQDELKQSNDLSSPEIDDFQDDDETIDKLLIDEIYSEPDDSKSAEQQHSETMAEIDEFAEDNDLAQIPPSEDSPIVAEQPGVPANSEINLDDFDITSDDDNPDFLDEVNIDEFVEPTTTPFESQTVQNALNSSTEDQNQNQGSMNKQTSPSETTQTVDSIIDEALSAQVSQLWAQLDELKQQPSNPVGDIEQFNKKLKRTILEQEESNKKNKRFTSIAMATAALASIIAIVSIIQNSSLKTTIADMNGLITDMEESASGPDFTTEKTLKNLKNSYLLLDNNQQSLRTQLALFKSQLNRKTLEPSQDQIAMQNTVSSLQTQITNISNKIETLSTSISKLDKRRPTKTVKKARKSKTKSSLGWVVNLVSFKQDWYARKKAAEFKNKGIPVEVAPIKVKGEQWYRLRVTGFKTKYEAGSYASRAKKALNLSSVWVAQK
jgi:cell division septation protein DedD